MGVCSLILFNNHSNILSEKCKKVKIMNKKYNIIYADPAWSHYNDMTVTVEQNKAKDFISRNPYPVMSSADIKALPIKEIADEDCILFIWTTDYHLSRCCEVIKEWGFEYKTCGFVWVKRNKVFSDERNNKRNGIDDFMGQGRWVRQNAELCLIATKGKPKRISAKVRQIIYQSIQGHSQKPNEVRERIIELCGDKSRIELFARENHNGWDAWGNEVFKSINL